VWEDEGGSLQPPRLGGSDAQAEWAEGLKRLAGVEFDRCAHPSDRSRPSRRGKSAPTRTKLAVLAGIRDETIRRIREAAR
jgi:hypothetical protein